MAAVGRLALSAIGFAKLKVGAGGVAVFAALFPNEKANGVVLGTFSASFGVVPNEKDGLGASPSFAAATPPNVNKLEELSLLSTGCDPKENFVWSLVCSVDDGLAPNEKIFEDGASLVFRPAASPNENGFED